MSQVQSIAAPDSDLGIVQKSVLTPNNGTARPPARSRRRGYHHWAIHVTVRFNEGTVEDITIPEGEVLQVGNSPQLAVPVPAGAPYIARVWWRGRNTAMVRDGRGIETDLGPDTPVHIQVGPVDVTLTMTPQFSLRRTEPMFIWGSLAWLAVVIMTTNLMGQADLVYANRCNWFGIDCQATVVQGDMGRQIDADYLARLLREDYDGAEYGYEQREEREDFDRKTTSIYLPAGDLGPTDDMGGAADTSLDPVRNPDEEESAAASKEEVELSAPDGVGTPIEEIDNPDQDDAVADASDAEGDDDEQIDKEVRSEEKEGWGVRDWYDASDQEMDQMEIDTMLLAARERLRINPDDPDALNVLSYYQYLAQDYDAAIDTYNRYIKLYPDSSAGYNNKALVYKRRGDYQDEENLYRVALALQPDDKTALNNLAVNVAHQGRYDEALAIMKKLETLDPEEPYADLHRSKIYAQMGDDDQALDLLDKALIGMKRLDTLHHIEFRQDIRVDPAFDKLRQTPRFRAILMKYYGEDSPLED